MVGILPQFPIGNEAGKPLEFVAFVDDEGGGKLRPKDLDEVGRAPAIAGGSANAPNNGTQIA
jgi:hypothetical protein